MNFELLSINEKDKWLKFSQKLPLVQQDIYFTPAYYEIYQHYGDGEPYCFIFEHQGETAIYPFLRNKIDRNIYQLNQDYFDIQGAYGYNGIASSSYDNHFIDSFYQAFNTYCKENNIVAEFTRFHPLLQNYKFSENHLKIVRDRLTVKLNLSGSDEEIWQNEYSKGNRNKIRKAEKNNVEIHVSEADEDYHAFYAIYSETMKGLGAESYYFFDEYYFRNFRHMLGENQKFLVARLNGEVVSALFLMLYGDYAHIHLSGSIYKYLNLGVNNLIKHQAVRYVKQLGFKYLNFGGGSSADPEDPLFKFKANFSNERGEFYIGKKVHNHEIYAQMCEIWEKANPDKREKYANFLLKYRMIND